MTPPERCQQSTDKRYALTSLAKIAFGLSMN